MNAHNEQLLISSLQAAATGNTTTLKMMELCGAAAKALSSNPTNQPAAAQEAVRKPDGYHYRYPTLYGTGTCIRQNNGEEVNGSKPIEAVPYWYAPFTAAPAMYQAGGTECQAPAAMCQARTTAAPGIDTGKLRELAGAIVASLNESPFGNASTAIAMRRAKQIVALIDASPKGGSEAVEPDTFFVMGCPGYPGGYSVYPNTMQNALKFIAEHGNEHTTLATWCRQYQRRDYTAQEVRALLASDAEVRP